MSLFVEEEGFQLKYFTKNTNFFLKKNFHYDYQSIQEREEKVWNSIIDIDIKCIGFGYFNPHILLTNFSSYITKLLQNPPPNLKVLKIVLKGFDMVHEQQQKNIIIKLAKTIKKLTTLKTLWIHTSHLSSVQMSDFDALLRLSMDLSSEIFQEISLQFTTWKFRSHQPTFQMLKQFLQKFQLDCYHTKIKSSNFRLEISGWWIEMRDAKKFFGFKLSQAQLEEQLKKKNITEKEGKNYYAVGQFYDEQGFERELSLFHDQMESIISQLLSGMPNIKDFQIDLRHCHPMLKMNNLRKKLDSISIVKQHQSIISKVHRNFGNPENGEEKKQTISLSFVV